MHELTKQSAKYIWQGTWERWETEVLLPWLKKRSEWLKVKSQPTGQSNFDKVLLIHKDIDQAFGISRKTLEEKISDHGIKAQTSGGYPDYYSQVAKISRQHFKEHPEDLSEGK